MGLHILNAKKLNMGISKVGKVSVVENTDELVSWVSIGRCNDYFTDYTDGFLNF